MNVEAIDFFCGCGGTSYGLRKAGINVLGGIDFDETCRETYDANLGPGKFIHGDITKIDFAIIQERLALKKKDSLLLFSACAPCQPFSTHNKAKKGDKRKSLLLVFSKFIAKFKPEFIFIENVPGLQKVDEGKVFKKFLKHLESMNYSYSFKIVNAMNYGVPQSRKRLILLASNNYQLAFPEVTHGPSDEKSVKKLKPLVTVRDAIGSLPAIAAGVAHPTLNGHAARSITEVNLRRLRFTPKDGGDRRSWPNELVLSCHKGKSGHEDVYGRLFWDKPAPALTCNCTSISNGRYGHPTQHRAITPREAALIQTFPKDYKFFGSIITMSKHIGNAVPVDLAAAFGKQIIEASKEQKVG